MNVISLKSREFYKINYNGKQTDVVVIAAPVSAVDVGMFIREPIEIDGLPINVVAVDMDGDLPIKKGQPLSLIYEPIKA